MIFIASQAPLLKSFDRAKFKNYSTVRMLLMSSLIYIFHVSTNKTNILLLINTFFFHSGSCTLSLTFFSLPLFLTLSPVSYTHLVTVCVCRLSVCPCVCHRIFSMAKNDCHQIQTESNNCLHMCLRCRGLKAY